MQFFETQYINCRHVTSQYVKARLIYQRPAHSSSVEYDEKHVAEETGKDEDELAQDHHVNSRSDGPDLPVDEPVDGK